MPEGEPAAGAAVLATADRPARPARRWLLDALPLVALVAVGALLRRDEVWFAGLHYDERVFLDAFAAARLGHSPYSAPLFNYPPPFAVVGGWLWERLGERPFLLLLRHAELLAACLVAWLAVAPTAWHAARKWALAVLIVGWSVPVGSALGCGNVAPLVAALALGGLALAPRRPVPAGLLLGGSVALKPMALAAVPLLALYRPPGGSRATRRATAVAALVAALAAALLLATLGARELPGMLGRADVPAPSEHDFSLGHLLRAFGIAPPALLVLAVVVTAAALVIVRRRPPERELEAVVAAACVVGLPVVWPHSLVFTFPLQALALERALAVPPGRRLSRPLAVALALGAALGIQGSSGTGGAPIDWPPPLRAALGAMPLVAVLVLCALVVALSPSAGCSDSPGTGSSDRTAA